MVFLLGLPGVCLLASFYVLYFICEKATQHIVKLLCFANQTTHSPCFYSEDSHILAPFCSLIVPHLDLDRSSVFRHKRSVDVEQDFRLQAYVDLQGCGEIYFMIVYSCCLETFRTNEYGRDLWNPMPVKNQRTNTFELGCDLCLCHHLQWWSLYLSLSLSTSPSPVIVIMPATSTVSPKRRYWGILLPTT